MRSAFFVLGGVEPARARGPVRSPEWFHVAVRQTEAGPIVYAVSARLMTTPLLFSDGTQWGSAERIPRATDREALFVFDLLRDGGTPALNDMRLPGAPRISTGRRLAARTS